MNQSSKVFKMNQIREQMYSNYTTLPSKENERCYQRKHAHWEVTLASSCAKVW